MRTRPFFDGLLALALAASSGCSGRDKPAAPPGGSSGAGSFQTSGGVTSGGGTSSTTTSGSGGGGPTPDAADLPMPVGACPNLIDGKTTFALEGLAPRDVELRFSSKTADLDGPLVVVWHGEDQTPKGALEELYGSKLVTKITAAGGIVAAPSHDPKAGAKLWFSSEGDFTVTDDFALLDQIVACTRASLGIDLRHIHLVGYQRGGIQTAHAAVVRSGYVASVVVHSGGLSGDAKEAKPGLAYPFMIVHGGETLDVAEKNYGASSAALADLASQGAAPFTVEHPTILCDHGNGPSVASEVLAATHEFLLDTPFGTTGSPYGTNLPSEFPPYCSVLGP